MNSAPLLAIDTSAARLQLALLRADSAVDCLVEDMAQGQAERIFPGIADLLARNSLAYADLKRLAVTTGPGSFTGLRIGLAAARGLGLGLNLPVIGVPTLLAMSLSGQPEQPLAVLVDARRGEGYFQTFSSPGVPESLPRTVPFAEAQHLAGAVPILQSRFCDIARLARFVQNLEPNVYPPDPVYIRDADAKPQDGARIARAEKT